MNCPNCGNTTFYIDEGHSDRNGSWGVGVKYICTRCGFKGSKEMLEKGNIRKAFSRG